MHRIRARFRRIFVCERIPICDMVITPDEYSHQMGIHIWEVRKGGEDEIGFGLTLISVGSTDPHIVRMGKCRGAGRDDDLLHAGFGGEVKDTDRPINSPLQPAPDDSDKFIVSVPCHYQPLIDQRQCCPYLQDFLRTQFKHLTERRRDVRQGVNAYRMTSINIVSIFYIVER